MELKETEVSSKELFHGGFISLNVNTVRLPNGKTATRELVDHGPAAAAICINDQKEMLLVEQWREAIKQLTLEIPAGMIDDTDVSPLDAMKREKKAASRPTIGSRWRNSTPLPALAMKSCTSTTAIR